jgi:hypothetical protein
VDDPILSDDGVLDEILPTLARIPRYPVFIVGSPRSGTSALVDSLVSLGYHGFREGQFLTLITSIGQVVDRHFANFSDGNPAVLISKVDKDDLKRRFDRIIGDIVTEANPKTPWFDKTGNPEMILAASVLTRLWPECVFIFAKRRAIENVRSRLIKFPSHTFKYHCADWARNMSVWRNMRERLAPNQFIEVDQQEMIREPQTVAARMCTFLRADPGCEEKLIKTLQSNRPQETEAGAANRVSTLDSLGWSEDRVDVFLHECQVEMEEYGYTLDESYAVPVP